MCNKDLVGPVNIGRQGAQGVASTEDRLSWPNSCLFLGAWLAPAFSLSLQCSLAFCPVWLGWVFSTLVTDCLSFAQHPTARCAWMRMVSSSSHCCKCHTNGLLQFRLISQSANRDLTAVNDRVLAAVPPAFSASKLFL